MINQFTYFDSHTHKKYKEQDVAFVRNAFHHLSIPQLNKLPYSFSVGLHPWDVNSHFEVSLQRVNSGASHSNCLAIGECGLDYFIKTDKEIQREVFTRQKALAESINKPLIIHCVRAYHDLIPLIRTSTVPIILHHYTGNTDITKQLLFDHIYFSFGKSLFHSQFPLEVLSQIPMDKILLETDTSAYHIEDIYIKAANLMDVEFEQFQQQITKNSRTVFIK